MRKVTCLVFYFLFVSFWPLHAQLPSDKKANASTRLPAAAPSKLPADSFFIDKEKEVWEALKH